MTREEKWNGDPKLRRPHLKFGNMKVKYKTVNCLVKQVTLESFCYGRTISAVTGPVYTPRSVGYAKRGLLTYVCKQTINLPTKRPQEESCIGNTKTCRPTLRRRRTI